MSKKKSISRLMKPATAVVVMFGCCLFIIWHIVPHFITKSRVEQAAKVARAKDLATGYCFEGSKQSLDWWGNPICIRREVVDDGKAITYTAISAGRDGKFETDDDYQNTKIDLNKSKMIGEYVGKRTRRAFEGFVDGVRTPDKFKDESGTDGSPRKPDQKRNWRFWEK